MLVSALHANAAGDSVMQLVSALGPGVGQDPVCTDCNRKEILLIEFQWKQRH